MCEALRVTLRWKVVVAAAALGACAPPQYAFAGPSLAIANPSTSPTLGEGEAVAVDGFSKHRWLTFTETEACFESQLSDLRAEDILPNRAFSLMGFKDQSQPMVNVPTIASTRVTVKSSAEERVVTQERAMPLFHVDLEVCFANPGRVVAPSTSYVVLRVPYSVDSDAMGAGSRDGVWRFTPSTSP